MLPLPGVIERHPEAYSISIARYAKGKYIIAPRDSRDGFMGPAGLCARDLNLKYVNRSSGYTASPSQVRKFEALYHACATPSFDRWLQGYPIRTNDLVDILTPVIIQVVNDSGLRAVHYTRGEKVISRQMLGDEADARRLYAAASMEI